VSCTAGAKEETLLYRSLQKLRFDDYYFFEGNRRGLPECYNEYLDRLAGTDRILVLVHADVTIADVFVQEKLTDAAKTFNIVGLAGSSKFDLHVQTPHYAWPVWPRECLSGAVEQVGDNGLTAWFYLGPTPRRCVVMDGLFLAIDMLTIGPVRFDPRFTFHLYDIDFCLTAHFANLVLGTTNVYVQHASAGSYTTPAYRQALQEFRAKWNAIMGAGS
jgi:hypothetical protein